VVLVVHRKPLATLPDVIGICRRGTTTGSWVSTLFLRDFASVTHFGNPGILSGRFGAKNM
jgi:hypothetical protein